jgi:hypothetical protein
MRVKTGACPLGSECEEVKTDSQGNYVSRCPWYAQVSGNNPQTGEKTTDWQCAIAWLPILLIENANTNRGQTDAICSMRDETIMRQDAAIVAMLNKREDYGQNLISK